MHMIDRLVGAYFHSSFCAFSLIHQAPNSHVTKTLQYLDAPSTSSSSPIDAASSSAAHRQRPPAVTQQQPRQQQQQQQQQQQFQQQQPVSAQSTRGEVRNRSTASSTASSGNPAPRKFHRATALPRASVQPTGITGALAQPSQGTGDIIQSAAETAQILPSSVVDQSYAQSPGVVPSPSHPSQMFASSATGAHDYQQTMFLPSPQMITSPQTVTSPQMITSPPLHSTHTSPQSSQEMAGLSPASQAVSSPPLPPETTGHDVTS